MKKSVLTIYCFLFLASPVMAGELFESNLSVRALGMGNAFTSVVDDAYALHYNPARLAAVDGFNFRLLDPYVLVSDPTKLLDVTESGSDVADIVNAVYDKNASGGLGTRASFVMPRFGIALYGDAQIGVNADNPTLPELTLRAVGDYGAVLGIAVPIIPGIMDMGIAVKRVIRQGGVIPVTATDVAELDLDLIEDEIGRKGSAIGLDLGWTASLPSGPLPISAAASFVWKNVGHMSFRNSDSSALVPPKEEDEMILSFAGGVDLGLAGVMASMDFKHLNESEQLGKKMHLGVEVSVLNLDARAGLHQGYFSYGAGISLGLLELDVASYGVELGEYAGQREDRRYAVQLTLELSVDPFFSLGADSKAGGRSSHRQRRRKGIKQRR